MSDPDDDALSWAGEKDPSLVASGKPAVGNQKSAAAPASPAASATLAAPAVSKVDDAAKPTTPSILLVSYGVLAGAFLIYTLGWVISVQRTGIPVAGSLDAIMFQLGLGLAIASPALWFAASLVLTRGRKPIVRLLWLLVGLVAVLPWPFVLGG